MARHTNLTDAVMRHGKLVRADLRGALLRSAETEDAKIVGALIDTPAGRPLRELSEPIDIMLQRRERWAVSGGAKGSSIDLSGFDLRATMPLAGACLSAMRAESAVFFGLPLNDVGLQTGQLQGVDFRCCRMARANLRGVNLKLARPANADLRDCNLVLTLPDNRSIVSLLEGAEMHHADLREPAAGGIRARRSFFRESHGRASRRREIQRSETCRYDGATIASQPCRDRGKAIGNHRPSHGTRQSSARSRGNSFPTEPSSKMRQWRNA